MAAAGIEGRVTLLDAEVEIHGELGIDGNKDSDVVTALSDARTKEHVVAALDLVEKHKDEVDKARFVQAFMAKKKENKDLWPEDVTSRTKAIIKKLS